MSISLHNRVRVFDLTCGKPLPEWLEERKKNRRGRRSAGGEHRIELIHDFEFPHFARCIFRSENGSYLFAAGDYPPRLKCYDVNQLSMKYSFNADMPIESGVCLSPDYRKFALRGQDRTITIHHNSNVVDRLRVPHIQRDLIFSKHSAELLSCGCSRDVHRLNLETGAFVEPFTTKSDCVNSISLLESNALLVAACEDGYVEVWDARQGKAPAGRIKQHGQEAAATHVSCDAGGLQFVVGTSVGEVLLYDIRTEKPLLVRDHHNGLPIVKTCFYYNSDSTDSSHILSADRRTLKVWQRHDGQNFTTIEGHADIYDFTVLRAQHNLVAPFASPDSGVICLCCDAPRIAVHFIPQLGPAPKWCSYLDTVVEELEEKQSTVVYEDYKFVSSEEMAKLGVRAEDVTDGKVRPAMHGVYIENAFYRELMAVVDPRGFERLRTSVKPLANRKN